MSVGRVIGSLKLFLENFWFSSGFESLYGKFPSLMSGTTYSINVRIFGRCLRSLIGFSYGHVKEMSISVSRDE